MAKGVTESDLHLFASALATLSPLAETDMAQVSPLLGVRSLGAGEHLLRAGEHASHVALVAEGAIREYFLLEDGTERTKAFVFEGELTGSLADLLSGEASVSYAVAERDTRLVTARYDALRALAARAPAWDQAFRRLVEQLYLRKARREYELLALDAAARYDALLRAHPDLEARVKARHVASYLGITPVHLSRLRRRRREAARPRAATARRRSRR